jgi:hypothetical protein
MYSYIFNIHQNKYNIIEPFGKVTKVTEPFGKVTEPFGKVTELFGDVNIRKSFEDNKNIDNSKLIESLNKVISNTSNNVIQKNVANSVSSAGASNVMNFSDIVGCDKVVISGVTQTSYGTNKNTTQTKQTSVNNLSTDIINEIDKQVNTNNNFDFSQLPQNKDMEDFFKNKPDIPKPVCNSVASANVLGLVRASAGERCTQPNFNSDEAIKQTLNLDNSFTFKDDDNIQTNISNMIDQSNYASCAASASAQNQMAFEKIKCNQGGTVEISDIEQKAIAEVITNCIFDQTNTNNISTKIANKIKKRYDQLYEAVFDKAKNMSPGDSKAYYDEKIELLDKLAAAEQERINAVAGMMSPGNQPNQSSPSNQSGFILPKQGENKNISDLLNKNSDNKKLSTPSAPNISSISNSLLGTKPIIAGLDNKYLLLISFIVVIFIIILLIKAL